MFGGVRSIPLKEGLDFQTVLDRLPPLGAPLSKTDNQQVWKRSESFYDQKTTVSVSSDGALVYVNYQFSPSVLSWLLAICFFPFGALVFILPNQAKTDFEVSVATI